MFGKKKVKVVRTWDIPEKDIPHILRLAQEPKSNTMLGRYEFFRELAKVLPETEGKTCRLNFRGAVPFVEEVR